MDIWQIIHIILAVLLAVNSAWGYGITTWGTSTYFTSTFFLFFEILIIIFPFLPVLEPYFGFLSHPIGPALSLIVIAVFYFYSLSSFCTAGGYWCLGEVTGCIVFIVCIVELFFKKDALQQLGGAALSNAKQLGTEGASYIKNTGQANNQAEQQVNDQVPEEYEQHVAENV